MPFALGAAASGNVEIRDTATRALGKFAESIPAGGLGEDIPHGDCGPTPPEPGRPRSRLAVQGGAQPGQAGEVRSSDGRRTARSR